MNTDTNTAQNLIQKAAGKKHEKHKNKRTIPKKFDIDGFFYAWGLAIVLAGIGIFIFWATDTAPGNTTGNTQRMVKVFPKSAKEILALIAGSVFIFSAIICIFLGLKLVIQYIVGGKLKYRKSKKSNH
jgi:hypothetical protein